MAVQKGEADTRRLMTWVGVIQLVCVLAFVIDIASEFPDPATWGYLPFRSALHLGVELGVVVLLMIGVALVRQAIRRVAGERDRAQSDLRSLRGDFDAILQAQFTDWNLTDTQRDIALLTLRGLTIERIAEARNCAQGTVKAHLNAIYRAGGFRTRGELVGFFMDELLEHGADEMRRVPSPAPV